MLSGQVRRARRLLPALLIISALCCVLLWRRAVFEEEQTRRPGLVSLRLTKGQEEYVDRRGVHVVVGHYMGDNHGANKVPSVSWNMTNMNEFSPQLRAGHNGQPVVIPAADLLKMQQLFQINRFNLLASDRIPLNRSLPDVRRKKCALRYTDVSNLPTTSIIIVFHNEAWSTLMRTIWSVIDRSPKSLLKEILLVDDASTREFLKSSLDKDVAKLPVTTRVLRSAERIGLVQARLLGANEAVGDVLTFLDAHCECTTGWLESLLTHIAEDRKKVVCPVIDIISDDSFAYVKSFELHWGALNWQLHFRWYTLGGSELLKRRKDIIEPFHTPTMAGGLFAIDREYFFEIGSYDEGMQIWGGENLEMSFRVWQCGGSIEIVPCSHVGHLFRKSSPYSFPGGVTNVLYSNLARVATVWMDDWAEFYFKFNPDARSVRHRQNVTARLDLRRELRCRSFSWYLESVWPQHFFPTDDRFFGRIRNVEENRCLIKPFDKGTLNQPMGTARLNVCLKEMNLVEMFVMTKQGVIMTDESVCLDAPDKPAEGEGKVRIMACSGFKRQNWRYDRKAKALVHLASQRCLDLAKTGNTNDGLVVRQCVRSTSQKWILEAVDWK